MSNRPLSVKSLVDQLIQRVAELEREVAELKRERMAETKTDWRRTVGMFAGDEAMKRIDAAGQAIRETERRRAKRAEAKSFRAN